METKTNQSELFAKVVLFGMPNSGKSTLLNAFSGKKVSIVSSKRQTTRNEITHFVIFGDKRILFSDTPGITDSKKDIITKKMAKTIISSLSNSDAVVLVVDASFSERKIMRDINNLESMIDEIDRKRVFLCLNKTDKITDKEKLLPLLTSLHHQTEKTYKEIFITSALKNRGLDIMLKKLAKDLPMHRKVVEREERPNFFLSELTRETIMDNFYDEIPYSLYVVTDECKKFDNSDQMLIKQRVIISNQRQRKIIIGKDGRSLSTIGRQSRAKMEAIYKRKHHLYIDIVVDPKWQENYLDN